MSTWKTAALAAALTGAAGLGAAFAPPAHGQDRVTVQTPAIQVLMGGARLGVTVRDVTASDAKSGQPAGVVIDQVTEGTAAAEAGLRSGDVVTEYDGERVRSVRQFTRLVQESVPGRAVTMTIMRDGQRQSITVTPREGNAFGRLGDDFAFFGDSIRGWRLERPTPPTPPTPPAPPSPPAPPAPPRWEFPELEAFIWRGSSVLGITTTDLSPQLADYFGVKDGVLVASVQDDSVAKSAGLEAGDVVTAIDGTQVGSASELRRAVQRLKSGQEFTIGIVRDRKAMTLKAKMQERSSRRTFRTII